jgi:hypothetical protein
MAEAVIQGMTCSPMRLDDATWVTGTIEGMQGEGKFIRNAWKKTEYEWFDDVKE